MIDRANLARTLDTVASAGQAGGDIRGTQSSPSSGIERSRFVGKLDPDRLLRVMERVEAMRLERLTGTRYSVKMTFCPRSEPSVC